jgi:hypothetical protein
MGTSDASVFAVVDVVGGAVAGRGIGEPGVVTKMLSRLWAEWEGLLWVTMGCDMVGGCGSRLFVVFFFFSSCVREGKEEVDSLRFSVLGIVGFLLQGSGRVLLWCVRCSEEREVYFSIVDRFSEFAKFDSI